MTSPRRAFYRVMRSTCCTPPSSHGARGMRAPSTPARRPRCSGRALERDGWLVGRITIEVLRPVPLAPLTVSAGAVARPGRNVELAQASLRTAEGGEELARATAWRLRRDEDPVVVPEDPPPPPPEQGAERPFFPTGEAVGYHTAMDYRFLSGSFLEAGPAVVWMRMRQPLVAGEPTLAAGPASSSPRTRATG